MLQLFKGLILKKVQLFIGLASSSPGWEARSVSELRSLDMPRELATLAMTDDG